MSRMLFIGQILRSAQDDSCAVGLCLWCAAITVK